MHLECFGDASGKPHIVLVGHEDIVALCLFYRMFEVVDGGMEASVQDTDTSVGAVSGQYVCRMVRGTVVRHD